MPHLPAVSSNKALSHGTCPLPTLVQAGKRIEKVKPESPEEVQRGEETGRLL